MSTLACALKSSNEKSKIDLLEINKSIPKPIRKNNSFEKIYNEYLELSQNKNIDISNSNFNPNNEDSPNIFVDKLQSRINLYYNSST